MYFLGIIYSLLGHWEVIILSWKLLLKCVVLFVVAGSESLTELMSAIVQRVGDDIDRTHLPRIMV